MADDRPVEDTTDQVARLQRELDDLKSTVFARLARKSTGDIEITLRPTPKEGALFLRGQTVSRAQYPDLWQWVQTNNLIIEDAFGAGDGSTTFQLPDMQGRVPIGGGTISQGDIFTGGFGNETYYIGRSGGLTHRFLTFANLPPHAHNGTTGAASRPHKHGGQTDFDGGNHGHHWDGPGLVGAGANAAPIKNAESDGRHSHHFTSATEDVTHEHGFTTNSVGGDSDFENNSFPLDLRQPYMTINWMIWA
jgi:microcystin-dependent protein